MASIDQSSLLELHAPSSEQKQSVAKKRTRPEAGGVSAAIGRENARLGSPGSALPGFPAEDSGHSLAEMARADLDAALQLLADRAQYITSATGAAIALRRGQHDDMLCHARVGSNAPELGSLLSLEFGLSGESVRTRQVLRCDDTQRDSRVNQNLCRELRIASVVIVPILKEQQVFGIFELLSDKAKAFNDRDLSALNRLAEMVATAVKHSGLQLEPAAPSDLHSAQKPETSAVARPQATPANPPAEPSPDLRHTNEVFSTESDPASSLKKPLFWSAALQTQASSQTPQAAENSPVPPVLRNLKKCQACGFPISRGRTLCVECEEKQWRGRNPGQSAVRRMPEAPHSLPQVVAAQHKAADSDSVAPGETLQPIAHSALPAPALATGITISKTSATEIAIPDEAARSAIVAAPIEVPSGRENSEPADVPVLESPDVFLSSAVPTESWLAANKYILIVLLTVIVALASIAILR